MSNILSTRRKENQERLEALRLKLKRAEDLAKSKACVYLTGSFARGEASTHSDLDLFIVGKSPQNDKRNAPSDRVLSRLDEICIKAQLIEQSKNSGFPDFSGDGEYLNHYSTNELISTLGKPQDDANNTFTARLLLLLESKPLLCPDIYKEIIGEVITAYWRDYEHHSTEFMPAFLANDILRLWRTFCINYEANTKREPEDKKAKRKIKNYKLKHSRLLTCYSALLFLLQVFNSKKTVAPEGVLNMVLLSPTERLEWLGKENPTTTQAAGEVLSRYVEFLQRTDKPEGDLIGDFLDPDRASSYQQRANELGDKVYELLRCTGENSRFYRLLVV